MDICLPGGGKKTEGEGTLWENVSSVIGSRQCCDFKRGANIQELTAVSKQGNDLSLRGQVGSTLQCLPQAFIELNHIKLPFSYFKGIRISAISYGSG